MSEAAAADRAWTLPPVPANEEHRLRRLAELDILDTLPEQPFDDLAALAAHLCDAPIALVTLVDRDRQWFKARHNHDTPQTHRDYSFCAHAIATPERPMIVADATTDPRFARHPDVLGGIGIRFYAGFPLVTDDGCAIGTLCVIDRRPRALAPAQERMLAALARQVMQQIALRQSVGHLRALQERLRATTVAKPLVRTMVEDLLARGRLPPDSLRATGERLATDAAAGELEELLALYAELGLGTLRQEACETPGRFEFRGASLLEMRQDSRTSTCFLAQGYLTGAVARVAGAPASGAEIACASRGDDACRFVVMVRAPPRRSNSGTLS